MANRIALTFDFCPCALNLYTYRNSSEESIIYLEEAGNQRTLVVVRLCSDHPFDASRFEVEPNKVREVVRELLCQEYNIERAYLIPMFPNLAESFDLNEQELVCLFKIFRECLRKF